MAREQPAGAAGSLVVPGYDGVEFDARLIRDGVPVVLHDDTLTRVQGRPERAAALPAETLEALGMPTLAFVLAALPAVAFLDVELKEDATRAVVDVLRSARGPELANTAVSSLDAGALAQLAERAARWPRRLNADELHETLGLAARLGCSAVVAPWTTGARSGRGRQASALQRGQRRATFDHVARLGVIAERVEGTAFAR